MKRLNRGVEVKTLLLIGLCYAAWFAGGMAWTSNWWWAGLAIMPFMTAFHSSLQHETIHGHPTPSRWLNEALVSLPVGLVYPYRRYRDLHLKHHNDINLTCPFEDPESYFWPLHQYEKMRPFMKRVFRVNNTLSGRMLLGPVLSIIGFSRTEFGRLRRNEQGVRMAWALHGAGLMILAVIVNQLFAMPVWVYGLFVAYPSMALISLRTYAEHQAAENVGARTAIVETNPALALLYLNNNLHIVHHANPKVPWYQLPSLYRERKDQFLAANENTLFKGYGEIAKRFAFAVKQPVDHPFMHRDRAGVE